MSPSWRFPAFTDSASPVPQILQTRRPTNQESLWYGRKCVSMKQKPSRIYAGVTQPVPSLSVLPASSAMLPQTYQPLGLGHCPAHTGLHGPHCRSQASAPFAACGRGHSPTAHLEAPLVSLASLGKDWASSYWWPRHGSRSAYPEKMGLSCPTRGRDARDAGLRGAQAPWPSIATNWSCSLVPSPHLDLGFISK